MILVNGKAQTQALDRGLQFGDGHFTTLRVRAGEPLWWPQHWQRLHNACVRLNITPPKPEHVNMWLQQAITAQPDAVVKVIITRGRGGRGYQPTVDSHPNVYVIASPLPPHISHIEQLAVANIKLARQPILAGLKTLNRLEQVLLAQERQQRNLDDLLVLDHQDYVIEAVQGNLFWRSDNTWFTPQLDHCGIAGVARQVILEQGWLGEVVCGDFTIEDLAHVEQLFVCNSVRGAVPLRQLNGRVLSDELPATLSQLIA